MDKSGIFLFFSRLFVFVCESSLLPILTKEERFLLDGFTLSALVCFSVYKIDNKTCSCNKWFAACCYRLLRCLLQEDVSWLMKICFFLGEFQGLVLCFRQIAFFLQNVIPLYTLLSWSILYPVHKWIIRYDLLYKFLVGIRVPKCWNHCKDIQTIKQRGIEI